jgi:hypothetical protein
MLAMYPVVLERVITVRVIVFDEEDLGGEFQIDDCRVMARSYLPRPPQ